VTIREAIESDAPGITAVHIESWRKTYNGIIPKEILDNLSFEQREVKWRDRLSSPDRSRFFYVATNSENEIIGFANGGFERDGDPVYKGELYGIYILDKYHRKNIGHQLTSRIAGRLNQAGIKSMLVWVLADNRIAMSFYEALGGNKINERYISFGDIQLLEYAYGWDDTRVLINMGK